VNFEQKKESVLFFNLKWLRSTIYFQTLL